MLANTNVEPTLALSRVTVVSVGARISVIAVGNDVEVLATGTGLAEVFGAKVEIVARLLGPPRHTNTAGTGIPQGTRVSVLTRQLVRGVSTPAGLEWIATVGGADVVVVAHLELPHTLPA